MSDSHPEKEAALSAAKGKILVIDDKFENLHFLVDILMNEGYDVRPAPNASLAFKAIQVTPPDLILLDIKMPGMDGYEVCERLKADQGTRDIPVIFLSALDAVEDKIKAFEVGGVDYITKPFQAKEVLVRVETHLSLRRLQQQAGRAAVIEERHRLARDLHDSVAQTLFSSMFFIEAGRELAMSGDFCGVVDQFNRTNQLIQQTLREMRLLLYQLRPPVLSEGLIHALQQRLDLVENRSDVQALLLAEELELPKVVEEELYWIAQEALNNILKHAEASEVRLSLRRQATHVILEIKDNGKGFDPEHLPQPGGMGLNNMKTRAEKLGGSLSIESQKGKGTTIHVRVEVF
ncbi:MAG: response regulator [Ardenticatenaceae bacterium]